MYQKGIYAIINTETQARYIGATSQLSFRMHRHYLQLRSGKNPNAALQADWEKYGAGAFAFEVLELVQSEDELALAELKHIQLALADGDRLYNSPKGNLYTYGSADWRAGIAWTFRPILE